MTWRVAETSGAQVVDFMDFRSVARRNGRFPQLVDPRSSVNGLFIGRFAKVREVSLKEGHRLCGLKQSAGR
jgi:hypothetical protein